MISMLAILSNGVSYLLMHEEQDFETWKNRKSIPLKKCIHVLCFRKVFQSVWIASLTFDPLGSA